MVVRGTAIKALCPLLMVSVFAVCSSMELAKEIVQDRASQCRASPRRLAVCERPSRTFGLHLASRKTGNTGRTQLSHRFSLLQENEQTRRAGPESSNERLGAVNAKHGGQLNGPLLRRTGCMWLLVFCRIMGQDT
eukprot:6173978-Pleurochrysis_carterae.AAC.1